MSQLLRGRYWTTFQCDEEVNFIGDTRRIVEVHNETRRTALDLLAACKVAMDRYNIGWSDWDQEDTDAAQQLEGAIADAERIL